MDRRVVVGLVGLGLAGFAGRGRAQTAPARDPSAQQGVGMSPIPSISDSINNTTVFSPAVRMAPSAVPSMPAGVGVDPTMPRAPIPSGPVGMTSMEPIQRSIKRGFGTGLYSSMFRKSADRPAAAILRNAPRVEPAPKTDASTIPSLWTEPPRTAPPSARPAPYAGRVPTAPRPQADPMAGPPTGDQPGRPAPFANDRPPSPRPRAGVANAPANRPAERPAEAPALVPVAAEAAPVLPEPTPTPIESAVEPLPTAPVTPEPSNANPAPTMPAVLPPPPILESATTPPPVEGTDPLGKVEPVTAQAPPTFDPVPTDPGPAPAPMPVLASAPASPSGPVDPAVARTSLDEVALKTGPVQARQLPFAAIRAAAVGDEIITINELTAAVKDQIRQMTAGQPTSMSDTEMYELKNHVAASILNGMIDQALVVQQARKKMKANPKAKQMFDELIEKEWTSQELPPLLRNTASSNVHELKIKLASEGKVYESMKEAYRKKMMFHEFLRAEIHNKVTADMIEMRLYYTEHLAQFDQPARMTWREVEINIGRYPNRAAARQKADEVLARLLHDEDFAAVARSSSNGPTASKGGLYVDMTPGSYGVPVVNDELNRIPTGQVSQVLEAPSSFHIIRVDSRRDKGPLRFDEVQDKVRGLVLEQNYRKAVDDYLARLREKTLIRTMFDNTPSDPDLARRNDPAGRR